MLRDALAAALAAGGGNITFDPTVFATPQTIFLAKGSLSVPSNTTITGPIPAGAPLVTVNGARQYTVFYVASAVVNASLSGLTITNGADNNYTGAGVSNLGALTLNNCVISGNVGMNSEAGIHNGGTLTLNDSTVSGNTLAGSYFVGAGAGIGNLGVMTITASSISGNTQSPDSAGGAGITNGGQNATLTLINSSVSGNSISLGNPLDGMPVGGGILNSGTLTLIDSTVSENTNSMGNTGGISNSGTLVAKNSIIADNYATGPNPDSEPLPLHEDDCDGYGCLVNGANGNVTGAGGSSNQPGSPAICAGLLADIPSGLTTDQRGAPRTTTYNTSSGQVTCVDAGAIQTHYSLSFVTQPPASVVQNAPFEAALQVSESGSALQISAPITLTLALASGSNGTLINGNGSTDANGLAMFNNLLVTAAGTDDALIGILPITTVPPPPSLKAPIALMTSSSPFDVTASNNVVTMFATSPAGFTFTVDGVSYTSPVTLGGWPIGSLTPSPQPHRKR